MEANIPLSVSGWRSGAGDPLSISYFEPIYIEDNRGLPGLILFKG